MDALEWIGRVTGASTVHRGETLQALWGGYGEIVRVHLEGTKEKTAIVKWIRAPAPRAGSRDLGDERKRRSYEVETTWYRRYASRCDERCRVPRLAGDTATEGERLLLLEDLDAADLGGRRGYGDTRGRSRVLMWLAAFHARFLGEAPDGLWETGTYWHLATRPDELAAIDDDALRRAAPLLDDRLRSATWRTIVHGDAKMPNFCFAARGDAVAAVDFQYVGGGVGVQDVAYLLSGRAGDAATEARELDLYFAALRRELALRSATSPGIDPDLVIAEWRALYPIARADFLRFLAGWAKDAWRADRIGRAFVRDLLARL